jgi:hypothetical protein
MSARIVSGYCGAGREEIEAIPKTVFMPYLLALLRFWDEIHAFSGRLGGRKMEL